MITISREGPYSFGYSQDMAAIPFSVIKDLIESEVESAHAPEVLGGRGFVVRKDIESVGRLVLKQYHRGGVLGRVNPSYYVAFGQNRPAREFDVLKVARELSVNAPEPLMWITRGRILYNGWLIMKEIPHTHSLAQVGDQNVGVLEPLLIALAGQVEKLILAGIYHIDLHPGNVLISEEGTVSIIDFDKARIFRDSPNKLRDLYLCRWRRAVIKHGLPDFLAEYVCAHLRKNFALNQRL